MEKEPKTSSKRSGPGGRQWLIVRVAAGVSLGIISTVSVCWGIAAFVRTEEAPLVVESLMVTESTLYHGQVSKQPGLEQVTWMDELAGVPPGEERDKYYQAWTQDGVKQRPPDWSVLWNHPEAARIFAEAQAGAATEVPGIFEVASGWPFPAMIARFHNRLPEDPPVKHFRCMSGIPLPAWEYFVQSVREVAPRALPLAVYWPGFLGDVAVMSAPWIVALVILPFARRSLRRRRGLCESCGYSMAGIAPDARCPECGNVPAAKGLA